MTENHPITPTLELFRKWTEYRGTETEDQFWWRIATQAAQWGADQELLACGNYLKQCAAWEEEDVTEFYNYRRPKPPSLKEQALAAAAELEGFKGVDIIRRALEQLPDLESAKRQSSEILDLSDLPQWTPEQVQKLQDLLGTYRNHSI